MPKAKLRIGVLFGGRSAEHEVSLVSAASIIRALDKSKYTVVQIGITPAGRWLSGPKALELFKEGRGLSALDEKILLAGPSRPSLVSLARNDAQRIDVIFPVLHGTFGEDGTVQGLLELADIPYVGSGVLGSAVGMDKVVTKQLCAPAGIPVVPSLWFLWPEMRPELIGRIERTLGYPCFVKPANSGSSVGISKVHNRAELRPALNLAASYDAKVLVEKAVENAREIELSVLGNDRPEASVPGEILSSNEFYDYDAKYVDGRSTAVVPARLPKPVVRRLRELAVRTFKAVNCSGMARVDFLVTKKGHRIYMNEINTIPGFTSISMYPKLWEASGLPYARLLDRLIALALERHRQRSRLRTRFLPKADWYRSA